MNYLSQRKGFLGYDAKQKSDHKVVVVPFGLEKTVSYGGGTKNGPKEIIKASHQVELFDEELNKEPYKEIGIKTLKPFLIKKEIKSALNQESAVILWGAIVGKNVSSVTKAERVESGALIVRVETSVWRQELHMQKNEIIKKINKKIGTTAIRDIRFI